MGNDERQPRGRKSLDDYGRGAESDCARAMAEIERVLHELAFTRRSSPERLSPANEAPNAPSLVPAPSPIESRNGASISYDRRTAAGRSRGCYPERRRSAPSLELRKGLSVFKYRDRVRVVMFVQRSFIISPKP